MDPAVGPQDPLRCVTCYHIHPHSPSTPLAHTSAMEKATYPNITTFMAAEAQSTEWKGCTPLDPYAAVEDATSYKTRVTRAVWE